MAIFIVENITRSMTLLFISITNWFWSSNGDRLILDVIYLFALTIPKSICKQFSYIYIYHILYIYILYISCDYQGDFMIMINHTTIIDYCAYTQIYVSGYRICMYVYVHIYIYLCVCHCHMILSSSMLHHDYDFTLMITFNIYIYIYITQSGQDYSSTVKKTIYN